MHILFRVPWPCAARWPSLNQTMRVFYFVAPLASGALLAIAHTAPGLRKSEDTILGAHKLQYETVSRLLRAHTPDFDDHEGRALSEIFGEGGIIRQMFERLHDLLQFVDNTLHMATVRRREMLADPVLPYSVVDEAQNLAEDMKAVGILQEKHGVLKTAKLLFEAPPSDEIPEDGAKDLQIAQMLMWLNEFESPDALRKTLTDYPGFVKGSEDDQFVKGVVDFFQTYHANFRAPES